MSGACSQAFHSSRHTCCWWCDNKSDLINIMATLSFWITNMKKKMVSATVHQDLKALISIKNIECRPIAKMSGLIIISHLINFLFTYYSCMSCIGVMQCSSNLSLEGRSAAKFRSNSPTCDYLMILKTDEHAQVCLFRVRAKLCRRGQIWASWAPQVSKPEDHFQCVRHTRRCIFAMYLLYLDNTFGTNIGCRLLSTISEIS